LVYAFLGHVACLHSTCTLKVFFMGVTGMELLLPDIPNPIIQGFLLLFAAAMAMEFLQLLTPNLKIRWWA
jgi:hypothetical protein